MGNHNHLIEDNFKLEDFPGAERLVLLNGEIAQILSDYSVILDDLNNGLNCLETALTMSDNLIMRNNLWQYAIILLIKNFGINKGRLVRLNIEEILNEGDQMGKESYDYFKKIRDKHIAHDENTLIQGHVGGVVVKGNKAISDIISINSKSLCDEIDIIYLIVIIKLTIKYCDYQYRNFSSKLIDEVNATPEEVIMLPDWRIDTQNQKYSTCKIIKK